DRAGGPFPLSRPVSPRAADVGLEAPDGQGPVATPRFRVGDRVRVRERHPFGHTRCPRYVRGHAGVVTRVEGAFPVPEIEVHAGELVSEPTYGVRFDGRELWGDAAEAATSVHVDLYERWLERRT
ncbi:MAG TPA: SH3-like domain-containing protein, partial [Acidimicrobiales bacterium]|nr:SH3-like domain-containing protein [Acidimicrobiales bacterium]